MKKFNGRKSLDEVMKMAADNGWDIDTVDFDKGGDWIWLRDMDGRMIQLMLNTVNYHFFLYTPASDEPKATESSSEFDGEEWYDEILNMLFVA